MFRTVITLLSLLVASGISYAEEQADRMKEDKQHVNSWNAFAAANKKAHTKILATHDIIETSKTGGYHNNPEYYREVTYTDKKTGRMLSRVQWETENQDTVHVMELFYYDDKGRVARDYTTAFLPGFRNAPVQTLVALHSYDNGLHAFRSFDAEGLTVFERCEGKFKGEDVDVSYEDYEIETLRLDPKKSDMAKPIYKACFGSIPITAGKYLKP